MKHYACAICLLSGLAACGGGGGGGSGIDPRLARLDIYEAQNLRVLGDPAAGVVGMGETADENIPTTGTMSLTGFATMRVETGSQPIILFGDADLQIDFDTSAAQGAVSSVFGGSSDADIADYTGTIDLQSNAVGQDMPLGYAGALSGGGQTLGFAGVITGVLLGNPASAFAGSDLEAQVDQNGTTRDGTIVIVLEENSR
ncbi:hypothetical protein [Yoonia sp.]|uniref:hypothetical protein n=1 Tax=Yoonia sp. TaxID=2212373 RepID=UPI002E064EC6|nr:hypothetical protein [Yoonia sp.]